MRNDSTSCPVLNVFLLLSTLLSRVTALCRVGFPLLPFLADCEILFFPCGGAIQAAASSILAFVFLFWLDNHPAASKWDIPWKFPNPTLNAFRSSSHLDVSCAISLSSPALTLSYYYTSPPFRLHIVQFSRLRRKSKAKIA